MPILRNTKMNHLQTTESFDLNKFSHYLTYEAIYNTRVALMALRHLYDGMDAP